MPTLTAPISTDVAIIIPTRDSVIRTGDSAMTDEVAHALGAVQMARMIMPSTTATIINNKN